MAMKSLAINFPIAFGEDLEVIRLLINFQILFPLRQNSRYQAQPNSR